MSAFHFRQLTEGEVRENGSRHSTTDSLLKGYGFQRRSVSYFTQDRLLKSDEGSVSITPHSLMKKKSKRQCKLFQFGNLLKEKIRQIYDLLQSRQLSEMRHERTSATHPTDN